jgi:hypothetical protein
MDLDGHDVSFRRDVGRAARSPTWRLLQPSLWSIQQEPTGGGEPLIPMRVFGEQIRSETDKRKKVVEFADLKVE